jgi:hypothetical protein
MEAVSLRMACDIAISASNIRSARMRRTHMNIWLAEHSSPGQQQTVLVFAVVQKPAEIAQFL